MLNYRLYSFNYVSPIFTVFLFFTLYYSVSTILSPCCLVLCCIVLLHTMLSRWMWLDTIVVLSSLWELGVDIAQLGVCTQELLGSTNML